MIIEHIALNVADPVALSDWYVRHLGMRIIRQVDIGPMTRFLADGAGRTVLEIYHQDAPVPDYQAMHHMVLHVAFKVADLQAERKRLLAAGATPATDVTTSDNGDQMTFLRDPWGVTIQLVRRGTPLIGNGY
jgi:catechol 2,3-dioxygenase-like lactoylglutathione lyase family enzyme